MLEKQIAAHPIFRGLKSFEMYEIVSKIEIKQYMQDEIIYMLNEKDYKLGFILSGEVCLNNQNYWGEVMKVTSYYAYDIIGEEFAFASDSELPVFIKAVCTCEMAFLDISVFFMLASKYPLLMKNTLHYLAIQKQQLEDRILIMSQSTIRNKVKVYLSKQVQKHRNFKFNIPHNRNELAIYLGVDRSALSAELSKMRQEGFIQYRKNTFTLL